MDVTSCFLDVRLRPCQNFDVLSTSCGRKYGRLDVIQNPGWIPRLEMT